MRTSFARVALLLALLPLTHCGQNDGDTPRLETTGARNALFWVLQVEHSRNETPSEPRPGAALGTYVASFLAHSPGTLFRSALQGIESQLQLLFRTDSSYSDSFQILEQLGTILEVDVRDLLNRSTNRTQTLDAYFQSLTSALQRATTHRDQLDERTDELNRERRAKRKVASDIQHILNTALREGDYATASEKQSQLIAAESDIAVIEGKQDQLRDITRLLEKLLDIGGKRRSAIEANREILLSGLQVVDMPGIDDLSIINEAKRRNRNSDDDLFGPTDF